MTAVPGRHAQAARCEASGVAFYYKQSAAYQTEMGIKLDDLQAVNGPRREL